MALTLSARGLGFGYPGHRVGHALDLDIGAHQVTMLLGPNGCGKTTLFRTLLGLLPAQAGAVTLDGMPLSSLSRQEIARRLAYVPQVAEGYFPFSVLDVVLMGRAPFLGTFEAPGRKDRELAGAALGQLGLDELADRSFSAISGGQRQLALIARALVQAAPVLIMDEPTANLDYGNQHRILKRARALASDGRTVVISSHNPDHALAYADQVVLIKSGTVIAAGPAEETMTAERLSGMYDMPVAVLEVEDGLGGRSRRCVPL
ncbi:MAG: ABC transporter ATP-binding protein [Nisaea sp.]|uniref:ABC transporter ATP-binding protein n=1 Tax=Nisaea sp. TaxID=2024842 RepID=UPI001B1EF06B|nr:ABC transporter ATP-binding protein [Nisaea sp.]MBO6561580.1 ABC transporter ATP-binding protein [Nisaea sp.]